MGFRRVPPTGHLIFSTPVSASSRLTLVNSHASALVEHPSLVERILLHENVVLPRAGNAVTVDLSTLVKALQSQYTAPQAHFRAGSLCDAVDADRPLSPAFRRVLIGGDKNSRHMIRRILACPYIVEALYVTRLGLSAGDSTPTERFFARGSDYEMWWKHPNLLLEFLYMLRILNLGPVRRTLPVYRRFSLISPKLAAACIYAQAAIIKRVKTELLLTLERPHFVDDPIRIKQSDIQDIIKQVCHSFKAPLLVRRIPHFVPSRTLTLDLAHPPPSTVADFP